MCTWAEIIWCVPWHCVQANANGYFHGKRVVSKKVMRVALQGEYNLISQKVMGGTWCSWIDDVLMGGARVMRNSMDQMRTFIYNHVELGK